MVIARILFVYVILYNIMYNFYAGLSSDTYINKSKIPTYPYINIEISVEWMWVEFIIGWF